MSDTNTTPGTELAVDEGVQEATAPVSHVAEADAKQYTPVFNDTVRTVIYILGLSASVVGLGFMTFGRADIGGFISTAAGFIAAGFGVAYNPLRMSER